MTPRWSQHPFVLGPLGGLILIGFLWAMLGTGRWSWTTPWPATLAALVLLATSLGGAVWVQQRTLALSQPRQWLSAGIAAFLGTAAIQLFWLSFFRAQEAFRLKAMVVGAHISEPQVEISRIVLSIGVACLVMGVATSIVGLIFQRMKRPNAALWVRMAGLSLWASLALGAFFVGRTWGLFAGG